MTRVVHLVMVMCPCTGGLSDSEAGVITQDWAAAETNVLLRATLKTAGLE